MVFIFNDYKIKMLLRQALAYTVPRADCEFNSLSRFFKDDK